MHVVRAFVITRQVQASLTSVLRFFCPFIEKQVMFADIVGFTAWSSEREPEQVFTLLQTVYHAFDR